MNPKKDKILTIRVSEEQRDIYNSFADEIQIPLSNLFLFLMDSAMHQFEETGELTLIKSKKIRKRADGINIQQNVKGNKNSIKINSGNKNFSKPKSK